VAETQKEQKIARQAIHEMKFFDAPLPKSPLIMKPRKGKVGISQI
jgi:hypothetical protein